MEVNKFKNLLNQLKKIKGSKASKIINWLLFFTLIYLIGGTVYNMKKNNLKGAEAVPNIEFWRELPHLFKDGILYSAKIIFGATRSYGANNNNGLTGKGYSIV